MAASVLMGILSGLGNLGEQKAEGSQIAREEQTRQAEDALKQQIERQGLAEGALRQKIQKNTLAQAQQPSMVGAAFTGGDGKTYARFQDPNTGKISVQSLPGPAPETPYQQQFRGLTALGVDPELAKGVIIKKLQGRGVEKKETQPDPNSPTGWSDVYYDDAGTEQWRTEVAPPFRMTPTETYGTSVDAFGNVSSHNNYRVPILPGGPQAPGAPPRPSAPLPSENGAPRAPAPSPVPSQGGMAVGTYSGLDAQGNIPARPGLNPNVVQFANDILSGRDTKEIPQRARAAAEGLARRYGWKGQGSLNPKEQLQIQEADASIQRLMNPELLKVLDGGMDTVILRGLTPDEPQGVVAREKYALAKSLLSPQAQQYFDDINQLRSLMGGFRKFTGGGISEAQVERYISELPSATSTPDSRDALRKLALLRNELQVAQRYGYFPKGESKVGPQVGDKVEVTP